MSEMTSRERVLTTIAHKEPDRVPMFLLYPGPQAYQGAGRGR